jgi:hypothetical protein
MMAIGDGIALAVLNMDCLHRAGDSNVISVPPSSPVRHARSPRAISQAPVTIPKQEGRQLDGGPSGGGTPQGGRRITFGSNFYAR